jgi:hypothetical protein
MSMEIVNRVAVKILEKFPPLFAHALLRKKSPLREWGWFQSFQSGQSVDASGRPIPWISYAAIDFLERRIPGDAEVFEYGAGNGTLWWAERVARVDAVEHDKSGSSISARNCRRTPMSSMLPREVKLTSRRRNRRDDSSTSS